MAYEIILFDLDGTLTDPTEGITKSVQHALAQFGIEEPLANLRSFIGPPLHQSFASRYGFDEAQTWRAVETYRDYFSRQGMYENLLFDGISALLGALREQGKTLYIVTSKPTHFAAPIAAHFELDGFFAGIIGANLDLTNSDKATLVRQALALHPGADPAAFVMIGDREHDIIGARANGIAAIGVTYGAGTPAELAEARASHIVNSVAELRGLLLGE
ncbi:MAG TPA: HAD family hydrolase [Thermomicrobiales bacterium]|jgi:phosphoglycolate phosphatase